MQGGSGFIGPHTNAHTGIHISARELARFGYLMLRNGIKKATYMSIVDSFSFSIKLDDIASFAINNAFS